jgi:hypothetical protein
MAASISSWTEVLRPFSQDTTKLLSLKLRKIVIYRVKDQVICSLLLST